MSMPQGKRDGMLGEFHHVSLLVKDVEKAARAFEEKFGLGPFVERPYEAPASKATVRGVSQGYKLKFSDGKIGPIALELVQPVEGGSVLEDALRERGEGLHHLAYSSSLPIDEELAKWHRIGIEPLQVDKSISEDPRYGWAYLDTEKLVGCVIEILCLPP